MTHKVPDRPAHDPHDTVDYVHKECGKGVVRNPDGLADAPEITPKMVEAGVGVLAAYEGWCPPDGIIQLAVREIWEAMDRARRTSSEP